MARRFYVHLLLMLWIGPSWAGPTLILASTEYPPYFSSSLPEDGTLAALSRAAFKAAGYDIQLVFRPWARLMLEVQNGKYDGVVAVWHKADRESFLALSDPVLDTHIGFYGRRDKVINVKNLQQLKSQLIGTVRGYANPPALDAAALNTDPVVDDLTNLRKLDKGRIDLAVIDQALANWLLARYLPEVKDHVMWLDPPLQTMPLFIGLARSRPDYATVLKDFNRGLAEIRRSGEYARILKRLPLTSD